MFARIMIFWLATAFVTQASTNLIGTQPQCFFRVFSFNIPLLEYLGTKYQ